MVVPFRSNFRFVMRFERTHVVKRQRLRGPSALAVEDKIYFFSLAGGTMPLMRRYSTICPYSSEACTVTNAAALA